MTDCLPTRPSIPLCARLKHSPDRSISLPTCSQWEDRSYGPSRHVPLRQPTAFPGPGRLTPCAPQLGGGWWSSNMVRCDSIHWPADAVQWPLIPLPPHPLISLQNGGRGGGWGVGWVLLAGGKCMGICCDRSWSLFSDLRGPGGGSGLMNKWGHISSWPTT